MGAKLKKKVDCDCDGKKEKSTPSKGPRRKWNAIMPKSGVIGPDGNPFYHHTITRLQNQHYERIKQCGIRIFYGNFSATEDRHIRKNWRRFAREHNFKDEDVWKFLPAREARAALGSHALKPGTSMAGFIDKEDFWCKMCRKLDGRTARQVWMRMCNLFNPFCASGEAYRPWTEADDNLLRNLVHEFGKDSAMVAYKMHRPLRQVEKRLSLLTNKNGDAQRPRHRDSLLDYVCHFAGIVNIFEGISQEFDFSALDWDEIAVVMGSDETGSELRTNFFEEKLPDLISLLERFGGNCTAAMKSLSLLDHFPLRDEGLVVIPLLLKQNAKDLKSIDYEKFKAQLVESGYVRDFSEAEEKCPQIRQRITRLLQRLTITRVHTQLTFNEKLRVYLEVFKDPEYNPKNTRPLITKKIDSLLQVINDKPP